ncbi:SagB/ThcOx family dehydrogenase [Streptomyces sp. NPDC056632]|uniref:SagB/ThcOx family dehydrogenase n=1 Tax=Streptomyces sp. NPDC056632 TaxID=3345884 RepID=UPI00368CA8B2
MTAPRDLLFVADRRFVLSDDGPLDADAARPGDFASLAGAVEPVAATAADAPAGPRPALDPDVARLLSALRRGTYLDYASHAATAVDEAIMRTYLAADPPPAAEVPWSGPLAWLPHPAHGTGERRSAGGARTPGIGRLLLSGFGHLRTASFLGLFDVVLKPVPSKGARHPFDAYVTVEPGAAWAGLAPGTYRYVPSLHALEHLDTGAAEAGIGAGDEAGRAAGLGTGVGLVVVAVFERVHWRYREPAGYRDLYLDLGHLTATLDAVAEDASLRLTPVEPAALGAPVVALELEVAAAYRLEDRT